MVLFGAPSLIQVEIGASTSADAPALNISNDNAITHSNWTEVVKSGIVPDSVLINKDALAMLLSAQPYEPKGWEGVFTVMLFGLAIFIPVVATIALWHCTTRDRFSSKNHSHIQNIFHRVKLILISLMVACKHSITSIASIKTRRSQNLKALGAEATFYLATQRESALLITQLAIVGCAVLLPLHLYIGKENVSNEFSMSTVQHLRKHSAALWIHTVFPIFVTLMYLRFIERCRGHLSWVWQRGVQRARNDDLWETTVFVRGIHKGLRETDICRVLAAVYPGEVQGVAMVLDTTQAQRLKQARKYKEATLHTLLAVLRTRGDGGEKQCESVSGCKNIITSNGPNVCNVHIDQSTSLLDIEQPRAWQALSSSRTCWNSCGHCLLHFFGISSCCTRLKWGKESTSALINHINTLQSEIKTLKGEEASITPENSGSAGKAFVTFYSRQRAHGLVNECERKRRIRRRLDELAKLNKATISSSSRSIHGSSRHEQGVEIVTTGGGDDSNSSLGNCIPETTGSRDAGGNGSTDNTSIYIPQTAGFDTNSGPTYADVTAESYTTTEAHSPPLRASSMMVIDENSRSAKALARGIISMKMHKWNVRFSPDPHDLLWPSMHVKPVSYWVRIIFVNLTILATLLLLTTPVAIFVFISSLTEKESNNVVLYSLATLLDDVRELPGPLGHFLCSFMPQIFLLFVNFFLVRFMQLLTKKWEPHMTRSGQQASILRKTFWFLLFNTLLLPSLALSSLGDFIDDLVQHESNPFALFGQVFVVSSGAFTLCYVITSTWVGSAVEMITMWDAWVWMCRQVRKMICCEANKCCCCSSCCGGDGSMKEQTRNGSIGHKIETDNTPLGGDMKSESYKTSLDTHDCAHRQDSAQRICAFDFGGEYAVWLTMVALSTVFAGMVPLILPFAVLYFVVHTAVLNFNLTWQAKHQNPVRSARPRIGRVALRHLALPLLLYQTATIGFFSSYVCVPGEVLLWNGWGEAHMDSKLVWENIRGDGTVERNTTETNPQQATLVEILSNMESDSSEISAASSTLMAGKAIIEEVLVAPDGHVVKPCLDGNGKPGTLALRGNLAQLMVLYSLCIVTTVFVVLRLVGEPSSQVRDDWALGIRGDGGSEGQSKERRTTNKKKEEEEVEESEAWSDDDDENVSLLATRRSGSDEEERDELLSMKLSPQETLALEQKDCVRVAMLDVVDAAHVSGVDI